MEKFEHYLNKTGEIGYISHVVPPLIMVKGLPSVSIGELVFLESDRSDNFGTVIGVGRDYSEVLLFGSPRLDIGSRVVRTDAKLEIPFNEHSLGKLLDPLCGFGSSLLSESSNERVLDRYDHMDISKRSKITEPFLTGVTLVDLMIPLGKGQRELVVGDRKTGKTEFLLQTMLTQASAGTICIYAGIAKQKDEIKKVDEFVRKNGISDKVSMIFSSASDPLGLIYITPYTAMTMAEFFMDRGNDVLLILDDMTTHAKFYREISLVGNKFPGRSSYPGDIFYTHARLLERAGSFKTKHGSRSITCLAAAETVEGDISGYIQTNLMSITDGHIFFDKDRFEEGRRPAINQFLSVTRVGRQTQSKLRWGINRELNSFFTLFADTQRFSHFGTELNEGLNATLFMGEKLLAFFNQPMGSSIDMNVQIVLFCLIWVGVISNFESADTKLMVTNIVEKYKIDEEFREIVDDIVASSGDFNRLLGAIGSVSDRIMERIKA